MPSLHGMSSPECSNPHLSSSYIYHNGTDNALHLRATGTLCTVVILFCLVWICIHSGVFDLLCVQEFSEHRFLHIFLYVQTNCTMHIRI